MQKTLIILKSLFLPQVLKERCHLFFNPNMIWIQFVFQQTESFLIQALGNVNKCRVLFVRADPSPFLGNIEKCINLGFDIVCIQKARRERLTYKALFIRWGNPKSSSIVKSGWSG